MLVNLVVKDGRCRSEGNVGIKFVKLRTVLEGGCRVAKDGSISFAESGHNLDMWKQVFPDSDIIKHANLDDQFASLAEYNRPAHVFKRSPLPWQKEADDKLQRLIDSKSPLNCFAFFYSAGGGKSLSLTNMITKIYCLGKIDAAIIIVPNILVGSQWTNDNGALNRDTQDDIASKSWLWKKGKKATEEYTSFKEFDGLQTLVMNIDAVRTPDGYKRLDDFIKHHRGRVLYSIDEVHGINNTTSQRHKKNVELASKCVWRAGLSGTPISKSLVNMYAIFRFLNPSVFGFKYAKGFMNEYCVMRWNGFADEVVGSKNVEQLYGKIAPVSTRISSSEMGLKTIYDEFEFDMSDEQQRHYDRLKTEWMTKLDSGEFASATIALTAAMKMTQVASGFIVSDEGEIQHLENNRLKAMDAWLETISDEKLVFWVRFKEDARILMNHLGDSASDLSGNVGHVERNENKNRFLTDPNIRFFIGSPQASGVGIDEIQNVCERCLYYSTSEAYILRDQSEKRILRIGGKSTSFVTDLICRKGPDRKILRNLKGKKDLSSYTLDSVRELFE